MEDTDYNFFVPAIENDKFCAKLKNKINYEMKIEYVFKGSQQGKCV